MGLFKKHVNQTRKPEGRLGSMMILRKNELAENILDREAIMPPVFMGCDIHSEFVISDI